MIRFREVSVEFYLLPCKTGAWGSCSGASHDSASRACATADNASRGAIGGAAATSSHEPRSSPHGLRTTHE